jgi:hypothetical protein
MNNEQQRVAVVQFLILNRNLHGRAEENYENCESGLPVSRSRSEGWKSRIQRRVLNIPRRPSCRN